VLVPYGTSAPGDFQIRGVCSGGGKIQFLLKGFESDFALTVPGTHSVYNAAAAIALAFTLARVDGKLDSPDAIAEAVAVTKAALLEFRGSTRRSEVIGEADGVLFIDDYAHHPTAVITTLKGIREFYPDRRLVVDFMSHTYSRTSALLSEFGTCFSPAHTVILHKIYASAREAAGSGMSGGTLYKEVARNRKDVHYFEEPMDAFEFLSSYLAPGDIFLTMGAGDNWKLGRALLAHRSGESR
jgi:UDP-N-acetylmuramate--alanine ligase